VIVESLEENFNILYTDQTGRTSADGAPMVLDPIGTFFGHTITVRRKNGFESEFDLLYKTLSRPRSEGVLFSVAHLQAFVEYEGYVSNGKRLLKKINETNGNIYWDAFTMNIIPIKAQVTQNGEDNIW
jgi:hypothetical protein